MKTGAVILSGWLFFSTLALAGNLGDYLPEGKVEGHFMGLAYSPRAVELGNKMMEAAKKNREWFLEAIKKAPPGEPLPYDERMGITPEEYKEFLNIKNQVSLKEVLAREINVIHNSDNTISLDDGEGTAVLKLIKFDPVKNTISTPYCDLADPKAEDSSKEGQGGALGPHTGIVFHFEEGDINAPADQLTGKSVSVTLGKILKTNKRFIYYTVSVAEKGQSTAAIQLIVEY